MLKRFSSQIGAATRFRKGHKPLPGCGRPRTAHLARTLVEQASALVANPEASKAERVNVVQSLALHCLREALSGSWRHGDTFLRLIAPHLSAFLKVDRRYARLLASAIVEIKERRDGRRGNADADQPLAHRLVSSKASQTNGLQGALHDDCKLNGLKPGNRRVRVVVV